MTQPDVRISSWRCFGLVVVFPLLSPSAAQQE